MTSGNSDTHSCGDVLSGLFCFDPGDGIYAHHFPGRPVVPGSLIVQAFMLAGERLGFFEGPLQIENFRFRRFISPGEYAYRIDVMGDRLQCTLYDGPLTVAGGTLKLCG